MAVTWGIERKVREVYINLQVLAGCPPYRLSPCLCITRNDFSDQAMLLVASMEKLPPSPWMPPEALPEYVAACKVCAHKVSQHPPPGLLHPLPVPHRPWSNIRWTSSQGCPHLKVTPPFSQWLTDFPRGCIPLLCPSSPLLSARGQTQFLLQLPSPSQTGCLNQELETRLHCLLVQNPTSWCKHLIWVEYAHNTLPCSASGLSPFECAYGSYHPLFPEVELEVKVPSAQTLIR